MAGSSQYQTIASGGGSYPGAPPSGGWSAWDPATGGTASGSSPLLWLQFQLPVGRAVGGVRFTGDFWAAGSAISIVADLYVSVDGETWIPGAWIGRGGTYRDLNLSGAIDEWVGDTWSFPIEAIAWADPAYYAVCIRANRSCSFTLNGIWLNSLAGETGVDLTPGFARWSDAATMSDMAVGALLKALAEAVSALDNAASISTYAGLVNLGHPDQPIGEDEEYFDTPVTHLVALSDVVSMLDLGSIGKTVRALDTVMCVDLGGLRASMIVSRDAVRAIDAGAALPGMHERASVSDVARVLVIAEASENVLTSDVGRSGILHLANDAVLATDVGALLLAIIAGRDSGLFEDTAAIVGPRTSGAQESGKAADSGGVKVVVAAADGVRCSDKEFVLITLDPMTDSVNAADSGGVVSWKVEAIDKVKCAEAYGVSPDGIYAVPNDDAGRARETANICVAIGATDAVSCTDKALAPAGPSAEDSVGCADSCSVRVTPGAYATAWS